MLQLPPLNRPLFGDEIVLKSIDWLENFPWGKDNTIQNQQAKYDIVLNVKDFGPEEIQIKATDGQLIIEAKHDEKKDEYGYISRHFVRRYRLPEGCKLEEVQSKLTTEGVLVVTVPKKIVVKQDTIIPVSHNKCSSKL